MENTERGFAQEENPEFRNEQWILSFNHLPSDEELTEAVGRLGYSVQQGRLGRVAQGWQWELHPDFIPDQAEARRRREEWEAWDPES